MVSSHKIIRTMKTDKWKYEPETLSKTLSSLNSTFAWMEKRGTTIVDPNTFLLLTSNIRDSIRVLPVCIVSFNVLWLVKQFSGSVTNWQFSVSYSLFSFC